MLCTETPSLCSCTKNCGSVGSDADAEAPSCRAGSCADERLFPSGPSAKECCSFCVAGAAEEGPSAEERSEVCCPGCSAAAGEESPKEEKGASPACFGGGGCLRFCSSSCSCCSRFAFFLSPALECSACGRIRGAGASGRGRGVLAAALLLLLLSCGPIDPGGSAPEISRSAPDCPAPTLPRRASLTWFREISRFFVGGGMVKITPSSSLPGAVGGGGEGG